MGAYLQLDLVDDRVGHAEPARPELMRPSVRVLLAAAWSPAGVPGAVGRPRHGGQLPRNGKRSVERIEDQRTGRKGLDIDTISRRPGGTPFECLAAAQPATPTPNGP